MSSQKERQQYVYEEHKLQIVKYRKQQKKIKDKIYMDNENDFLDNTNKKVSLNSSFQTISRETRETIAADQVKKPPVRQYNPKYKSTQKRVYEPYVRKNELAMTLDGHIYLPDSHMSKRKNQ